MIRSLFLKYFELVFWIAAIISLALTDPNGPAHFTLCPLKLLGITWCPGCGLGHAISFVFHGDIRGSFHAHWLGIPALVIILHRIYVLGMMRLDELKKAVGSRQFAVGTEYTQIHKSDIENPNSEI